MVAQIAKAIYSTAHDICASVRTQSQQGDHPDIHRQLRARKLVDSSSRCPHDHADLLRLIENCGASDSIKTHVSWPRQVSTHAHVQLCRRCSPTHASGTCSKRTWSTSAPSFRVYIAWPSRTPCRSSLTWCLPPEEGHIITTHPHRRGPNQILLRCCCTKMPTPRRYGPPSLHQGMLARFCVLIVSLSSFIREDWHDSHAACRHHVRLCADHLCGAEHRHVREPAAAFPGTRAGGPCFSHASLPSTRLDSK
jgi:hypothetical protein